MKKIYCNYCKNFYRKQWYCLPDNVDMSKINIYNPVDLCKKAGYRKKVCENGVYLQKKREIIFPNEKNANNDCKDFVERKISYDDKLLRELKTTIALMILLPVVATIISIIVF